MKTIHKLGTLLTAALCITGCVVGEVGPPGGMPSQNGSDTTDGYGAVVQVLHRFEGAAVVLDHYPNTFDGRHARRLKATGLSSRYEAFFQKVVQSSEFDIDELELQRMQELREALATAAQ